MASSLALILPDSNIQTIVTTQEESHERGIWDVLHSALMNGYPGRTLEHLYTNLGRALEGQTNRVAYKIGLGPQVVAKKINSYFGDGEQRGERLESLRESVSPKLDKYCSRLMCYSFPTESAKTQLQSFKIIVDVTTLFPGLRGRLLAAVTTVKQAAPGIPSMWHRTTEQPSPEWAFWQALAAVCLTETAISVLIEQNSIPDLPSCNAEGINPIEWLLLERGRVGTTDLASALCIRYLSGILDLPGFWFTMDDVHSDVARKLCSEMVLVLKDIGVDILVVDPWNDDSRPPFDYDGVDSLTTILLRGLWYWFNKLGTTDAAIQPWYADFRQIIFILRRPRAAQLLPNSADYAVSTFEGIFPTILQDTVLDVFVVADETIDSTDNEPGVAPDASRVSEGADESAEHLLNNEHEDRARDPDPGPEEIIDTARRENESPDSSPVPDSDPLGNENSSNSEREADRELDGATALTDNQNSDTRPVPEEAEESAEHLSGSESGSNGDRDRGGSFDYTGLHDEEVEQRPDNNDLEYSEEPMYSRISSMPQEREEFPNRYAERMQVVTRVTGRGEVDRRAVNGLLAQDTRKWAEYFGAKAGELIKARSMDHIGKNGNVQYLDVVRDVINVLPVYWICQQIAGLPLRGDDLKDEQKYYELFSDVGRYFLNAEPTNDWKLRESSVETYKKFETVVKKHLGSRLWDTHHASIAQSKPFLDKLYKVSQELGQDDADLVAALFTEIVPTAAHWSQAIAHVVNFYLDAPQSEMRQEIVALAQKGRAEDNAVVAVHIRNALAQNPVVWGMYRTAQQADSIVDSVNVQAGTRVSASIEEANMQAGVSGRGPILGTGEYGLLSHDFFVSIAPQVLGKILGLKNLKRAPGTSGKFNKFVDITHGSQQQWYVNARSDVVPWPESLVVEYHV